MKRLQQPWLPAAEWLKRLGAGQRRCVGPHSAAQQPGLICAACRLTVVPPEEFKGTKVCQERRKTTAINPCQQWVASTPAEASRCCQVRESVHTPMVLCKRHLGRRKENRG